MKKVKKVICEYCGREISKSNYSKHIRSHENGNFDKNASKYSLDHDDLFCKFCNKEFPNRNSLAQHEIRCKKNPLKIDTSRCWNNGNRPVWNKGLTKETDSRVLKSTITYKNNHKKGLHKDMSGENNPSKRPEVKKKISETMKSKQYPRWHISRNKKSFAEVFFATVLENNGIKFETEFPVKNQKNFYYYLDFFIEYNNKKIDLEIDGQQHKEDERILHDIKRDSFLKSIGYYVYRIEWNEINSSKGKSLMQKKINDFINFYNNL